MTQENQEPGWKKIKIISMGGQYGQSENVYRPKTKEELQDDKKSGALMLLFLLGLVLVALGTPLLIYWFQ